MDILIIDQCSNKKSYPDESPVFAAPAIDEAGLEALCNRNDAVCLPARKLYDGRQQRYIDEAVDSLRSNENSVDRYFISAGFGLVEEDDALPPYDVTFAEMTASEIDSRATSLEITECAIDLLTSNSYDIVFFALGNDYYRALDLSEVLPMLSEKTLGVTFNQENLADQHKNVISIPARTEQAKEHGSIVVALKGTYLKNVAGNLATGTEVESLDDVRSACLSEPTSQKDLTEF
ncbi:DUF6884 domain-containing protein [Natronolimnobius baerhuensis]|uniref:DUF6884 domain-containing protein n=1 Tax=Natronolimnobius baerhuensis TaxID=253108 RepID=A0A202E3V8_9EURY|nr:hypothetical protein [Natronolimnobius baerhuensis]OVE82976.1 hypothetical protein B2G88_18490 [Natronolimnobius baerhuensis]